jgi:RNA polymerase sigma-70 factor (ECF subfamily)
MDGRVPAGEATSRPAHSAALSPADLDRFRAGHPDGVRAVYRAYGALVYAVAYRALGSRELAEEASQQTFIKAWQAAGTFDPGREPGPWLATIARRCAIDVHRREARRATAALDDVPAAHPELIELPPGAERSYEIWEVRAAVDQLPHDEREVVRLQHLQQLSHQEISQRLGLPLGTVKSRSHRAHRRLAARLGHLRTPPSDTAREEET